MGGLESEVYHWSEVGGKVLVTSQQADRLL